MATGIESQFIFGRCADTTLPVPVAVDENGYVLIGSPADAENEFAHQIVVTDAWEVLTLSDAVANDNDKNFTVPAGTQYQVLWVYVTYTSDGTAGNRNLSVTINNPFGVQIFEVRTGVTQAASLTYNYTFAPSLADLTAVRDTTFAMTPLPPTLILPAGYTLRIYDQNNVSAGDDFTVYLHIARRAV